MKKLFFPFLLLVFASAAVSAQEQTVREETWSSTKHNSVHDQTDTYRVTFRTDGTARVEIYMQSTQSGGNSVYTGTKGILFPRPQFRYESWEVTYCAEASVSATWALDDNGVLVVSVAPEARPSTFTNIFFSDNIESWQQSEVWENSRSGLSSYAGDLANHLKGSTYFFAIDTSGDVFRLITPDNMVFTLERSAHPSAAGR